MPAETFSKPLEAMLRNGCSFEYYNHTASTFSQTNKTRICHVILDEQDHYNKNVILMVFTIRNQNGKWKIHSEGAQRTDPGTTVPLKNAAVKLAAERGWKYLSVALVGEGAPEGETVAKYAVVMESYTYGNETVYDLTNELATLANLNYPDFHRCQVSVNGKKYSFAFVKREKFIDYLSIIDDRAYHESTSVYEDIFSHNVYGIHIMNENTALSEDNPHVCVGGSALGDVSSCMSKEELNARHAAMYPDATPKSRGQSVGQIYRFIHEVQIGDYVILAEPLICHIGRITSNHYYDASPHLGQDADYVNIRDVEWIKKNISRSELTHSLHYALRTSMSFFGLNDYKSAIAQLLDGSYEKELLAEEDVLLYEGDDVRTNYTVEELGVILKDMYDSAAGNNSPATIHVFGIKYGAAIKANGYSVSQVIAASHLSKNYETVLQRALKAYEYINEGTYGLRFNTEPSSVKNTTSYIPSPGEGINRILYGVPGCGKSYFIEHTILGKDPATQRYAGEYAEENIIRTTFYQDYSNTDFVGQILPKVKSDRNGNSIVEYEFTPGPFTIALRQAIKYPEKKIALVVEEINRGNAPAIFGDVFQLLDRDSNGVSVYGIKNVGVIDYLETINFGTDSAPIYYKFNDIKIPGNLFIYATMNTSDQNVYTLDTAFVRRWEKQKIANSFDNCSFSSCIVPGTNCTWQEFVEAINKAITSNLEALQVNEDKQIGAFFVKESLLVSGSAEDFAYKVFDYLWNDVAKLDHSVLFNNYKTLDDLIKAFKSKGVGVFKSDVFQVETPAPQDEVDDE